MFRDHSAAARPLRPSGLGKEEPLQASHASSTPAGPVRQPTYNTVGSVYDPKVSVPLQAPARRSRAQRHLQDIQIPPRGDFAGFSALLSTLSLGDQAPPSPPTTASILQQYSPLQQNYDRAATPVQGGGFESTASGGYSMAASNIRSGNLPSPSGFKTSGGATDQNELTSRISTRGLKSLASFLNPMQKAAQDALERARVAIPGPSRPGTPSSLSPSIPDLPKDRFSNNYGTRPASAWAPEPLKAGPPGQRAFKPTTAGSGPKLFRVGDTTSETFYPSKRPSGLHNLGSSTMSTLDGHNETDTEGSSISLAGDKGHHGFVSRPESHPLGPVPRPESGVSEKAHKSLEDNKRKVYDTLPSDRVKQYFPNGFPSNYDGRHMPIADDWETKYLKRQEPFDDWYTKCLGRQETFDEWATRAFDAGTERLVKSMEQVERDHNYPRLGDNIGVIGGERQRARERLLEPVGADGKVQPRKLTQEDIDEMSEAEAAEPLLDMALRTLSSYKPGRKLDNPTNNYWANRFVPADDAWIDTSGNGNMSFFDEPEKVRLREQEGARKHQWGY
ncbi:hypothetical protein B0J18DRAFT_93405 [Chaetomium sp. MPI-SDFR-AT-0129]|nr:hypothetical protein B0J18DRAFT_93405 [Chaetomium sp. MPI-SDFR-AT-0129]